MHVIRNFVVLGAALALVAGCSKPAEAPAPAPTSVGTKIDDTVLTTRVKSALLADPDIKSFDIKVETRKGGVQLSGFVNNQDQIDRAVATTRAVEGVERVDNEISLTGTPPTVGNTVDDGIITTKVKSALLADPAMNSLDINVVTSRGEVQLSGFVNNQSQIDMAIAIARKIDGVTSVGNGMTVKL